jgi:pimeloyl-ACP methyl ester carboxylesterase
MTTVLAADPALAPALPDLHRRIGAIGERIASGDHAGAAEQFVETVAPGPGSWAGMPPPLRQTIDENALTFLDEANDPVQLGFDLAWIRGFSKPALLALGEASPPIFSPVVARLAGALPQAEVVTVPGAGHIPPATHPDAYAETIRRFTSRPPPLA